MKMKTIAAAVASVAAVGFAANAQAALIYFGEDLNSSATVPLAAIPNSSAAEASFLSGLVGVGTETFEGIAAGTTAPLMLTFPGAGTATLTGGSGSVQSVAAGTTNGVGRYSIPSGSSSRYWEVQAQGGSFVITFSGSVAAFGFYGIDIGDYGGQLTLGFSNGQNVVVNNTSGVGGSTDGSVLFFGYIAQNPLEEFTSVTFNTTAGGSDFFAFDNFTIGSAAQVQIPEPGSLALMGLGLAGLAAWRRRRKAA